MTWTWTMESGVNGDVLTWGPGNTGADGGQLSGGTGTISTAQAFLGTRSALMTATSTSGVVMLTKTITGDGALTLDVYYYWLTLPSAEITLARMLDGSATPLTCWSISTDSSGHIRYRDATGAQPYISSSGAQSMTTGQWSHLKIEVTSGASAGTMRVRYYIGSSGTASADSTVLTGQNTRSGWATLRVGLKVGTGTMTGQAYLDAVTGDQVSTASVTPTVGTVTFAGTAPSVDGKTLASGGGSAALTMQAFTPSVTVGGATIGASVTVTRAVISVTGQSSSLTVAVLPTLTATADPANDPPRVILDIGAAVGTTVTIYRIDQAGNRRVVRTANPATLTAGAWVGFDYEAPYGKPVTYTATTDAAAGTSLSASVTLTVDQPWLVHPTIPSLSVALTLTAPPTRARASSAGLFRPLGRAEAVSISSGQRQGDVFDLTVSTSSEAEEEALFTLLDDEKVLLLQITYAGQSRTRYQWVAVGDITAAPLVEYWGNERHVWTLPCTVAAPQAGYLQAQRTWADVVAENATWADVIDSYATWRDLITGNAS